MTFDKKRIRQTQSHEPPPAFASSTARCKGGEGPGRVEQVALDVHACSFAGEGLLNGGGVDHDTCAQIGRHRPPGVEADEHQALARADTRGRRGSTRI